jgi:bis(5'-nucleosyl)-tetraphosphatase (symmetrical)
VGRVIVYGDIHGCCDELIKLRERIEPKSDDIEITVGDFLSKGPDSIETLRYLYKNSISSVLGNHELSIIRHYYKNIDNIDTTRSHYKIANSLNHYDISYLNSLPVYKKIGNISIVHGGVSKKHTIKSINSKNYESLISLRYIDKHHTSKKSTKETKEYKFWAKLYDGKEGYIIYGHTPFDKPRVDRYSIGIDTGCVQGNRLTAIIIDNPNTNNISYSFESVEAKHAYI